MKKKILVILSALLLVLLAACGDPQSSATPQQPESTSQAESTSPAAPPRDEETVLTYYLEGIETQTQVVLYQGSGYSIYTPAMEWTLEQQQLGGQTAQVLQSDWNPDVMLSIVGLDGMELAQAQDWVRQTFPAYDLIEDARGGLGGSNAANQLLDVIFHPASDTVYAVLLQYPLEAAEGFGTRMNAFADTFELNP